MADKGEPLKFENPQQIVKLLAKEIYDSPYAFLRENVQNAFDAIKMQMQKEKGKNVVVNDHIINVDIKGSIVTISDTGIGMSQVEMDKFFWSMGGTSKNNPEAISAGVVGTFGIGGMANFGIAEKLTLISRTRDDSPGEVSYAEKKNLSTSEKCIFYRTDRTKGRRGTSVIAQLNEPLNVEDAIDYLSLTVEYVDIPVYVNGQLISGNTPPWLSAPKDHARRKHKMGYTGKDGEVELHCAVSADNSGRGYITFDSILIKGKSIPCLGYLFRINGPLNAYRNGFFLANVAKVSAFGLGGFIDCSRLVPTAGRDSLESVSKNLVQTILRIAEEGLAQLLFSSPQITDRNNSLFYFARAKGRISQLSNATVEIYGFDNVESLGKIQEFSKVQDIYFTENRESTINEVYSKQGRIVCLLTSDGDKKYCQRKFLESYCKAKLLDATVTAREMIPLKEQTPDERGLIRSLTTILKNKYFLENFEVLAAELTENALVWVPEETKTGNLTIFIDLHHAEIRRLNEIRFERTGGYLVEHLIRDYVFPHIKNSLPSAARQGFDFLMEIIRSRKEIMELDSNQIHIVEMNLGTSDIANVIKIQSRANEQGVKVEDSFVVRSEPATVQKVRKMLSQTSIPEKILDFSMMSMELSPWIQGYYLGLTEEAHGLYRDILERLPKMEFLWGAYRGSFLFFEGYDAVLYYDIEFPRPLSTINKLGIDRTGKIEIDRNPLFTENNVFIPIPGEFQEFFVPSNDVIRLILRHEFINEETRQEVF